MNRGDIISILIAVTVIVCLGGILVWAIHGVWWDNYGKPIIDYCKDYQKIIYVNQTALTKFERCMNYLLEQNYELLDKNGSYYILEPKK